MGGTGAFAILIALLAGVAIILFHYHLLTSGSFGLGIAALAIVGAFMLYGISRWW